MIEVKDLRRSYGAYEAVRGVSFSIPPGSIWGLLGPNGAGKTTIIEMILGLRRPTSGLIRVSGLDPTRDTAQLRRIMGAQLQSISIPDKIRVLEAIELFASFYDVALPSEELLDLVGLQHRRSISFEHLSGGEKQRVALALALVGNPKVLLLDEPTTGLDADSRRALHDLILRLRDQGRTVVLTTHYLEEAERLCDQVGIIDHGELLTIGSPHDLINTLGRGELLEIVLRRRVPNEELELWVGPGVSVTSDTHKYILRGDSAGRLLAIIAVQADKHFNEIVEARVRHVNLEDVYLQLIGETGDESRRAFSNPQSTPLLSR